MQNHKEKVFGGAFLSVALIHFISYSINGSLTVNDDVAKRALMSIYSFQSIYMKQELLYCKYTESFIILLYVLFAEFIVTRWRW